MHLTTPPERLAKSGLLRTPRDRSNPHTRRALANSALLGLLLLASCDSSAGNGPAVEAAARSTRAELDELVVLMTPLQQAVTSDITDRNLLRGRELLGRLRAGPREVGLDALERLRAEPIGGRTRPVDVDRALLDVASHAAPADTRPLLEALLTQYGAAIELRTEAALLLAETSPERAIELMEPMVTKARPNKTSPPQEFVVKAWVTACDKTGRSPVSELADVATNLYMDETARILAVKELGRRPEPLALQALQAILIESTGDGYLRRMAAQGLRDSLPKESGCEIFELVASREADINFAQFLSDLLQKHCR